MRPILISNDLINIIYAYSEFKYIWEINNDKMDVYKRAKYNISFISNVFKYRNNMKLCMEFLPNGTPSDPDKMELYVCMLEFPDNIYGVEMKYSIQMSNIKSNENNMTTFMFKRDKELIISASDQHILGESTTFHGLKSTKIYLIIYELKYYDYIKPIIDDNMDTYSNDVITLPRPVFKTIRWRLNSHELSLFLKREPFINPNIFIPNSHNISQYMDNVYGYIRYYFAKYGFKYDFNMHKINGITFEYYNPIYTNECNNLTIYMSIIPNDNSVEFELNDVVTSLLDFNINDDLNDNNITHIIKTGYSKCIQLDCGAMHGDQLTEINSFRGFPLIPFNECKHLNNIEFECGIWIYGYKIIPNMYGDILRSTSNNSFYP